MAVAKNAVAPVPRPPKLGRVRGLDGLKGLAMLAVLAYHLFGWWAPGGFVGIEVFFTVSGFLTGRSFLFRLNSTGKLGVGRYASGRLKRIVPATWFMAACVTAAAWAVNASDALVGIKNHLIVAGSFVYNWYDIATGADYFAATGPELLKHLWFVSLLVQFYLVAPLVVWFLWKFFAPRRAAVVLLLLALGSAVAMGLLYQPGGSPTRVYFGTDTNAFGLLIGLALAFLIDGRAGLPGAKNRIEDRFSKHRFRYSMICLTGAASLALLIVLTLKIIRQDSSAFRGGLLLACLLTTLVILGGAVPGSWLGRLLDIRPLAFLGKHSFGVYLWHWPISVLVLYLIPWWRAPNDPRSGLLTLALTVPVAWVATICIERPIVSKGFFHSLVPDVWTGGRRAWLVWSVSLLLIVFSVSGTVRAVLTAPQYTQTELLLMENAKQAAKTNGGSTPGNGPAGPGAPGHGPGHHGAAPKPGSSDLTKEAIPQPLRLMPTGAQMTAVGDSVMLAAKPALAQKFPGISIDAAVSRSMYAGVSILTSSQQAHTLRQYVVVSLGTNGFVPTSQLDQLLSLVGPGRVLVLVNAHGQRSWIPPTNQTMAQFAAAHPHQVILADWDKAAAAHEDYLYSDGIHPMPGAGANLYAQTVHDAIAQWVKAN